ncbi:hypothetical protein ES703_112332 [subsurface metagenome]
MDRYTSTRRSPHLDCLELPSLGDTAANIENHIFDGHAHWNLHQASVVHLACQGKDLGPFSLFSSYLGIPFHAVFNNQWDIGPGLNIIDIGRLSIKSRLSRKRGSGPRHSPLPLNGGHECGFFTADKGPSPHFKVHIKIKAGTQDILPQKTQLLHLFNGYFQVLHCYRIFFSHVNVPVFRSNSISTNEHSLEDSVGITFQHGTIHKCPGIPFVRIADDILGSPLCLVGEFPFQACRKAGPYPEKKPGNGLDNSLISTSGNVMLDPRGIDLSTIGQHPFHLFLIKRDLTAVEDWFFCQRVGVSKVIYQLVFFQGKGHDLRRIIRAHLLILNPLRINGYHRCLGTKPVTSCGTHLHLPRHALFFDLLVKGNFHLSSTISTATCHAYVYSRFALIFPGKNLIAIPL